ncbi:MAG: hypothetical protein P1U85_03855 [Verrucomicrobiales bacterium]|jgi:hypothetical protein|nr:hypothetical protein [Verrucomicrobiales bacterium]
MRSLRQKAGDSFNDLIKPLYFLNFEERRRFLDYEGSIRLPIPAVSGPVAIFRSPMQKQLVLLGQVATGIDSVSELHPLASVQPGHSDIGREIQKYPVRQLNIFESPIRNRAAENPTRFSRNRRSQQLPSLFDGILLLERRVCRLVEEVVGVKNRNPEPF